jgi:hypothetical protein
MINLHGDFWYCFRSIVACEKAVTILEEAYFRVSDVTTDRSVNSLLTNEIVSATSLLRLRENAKGNGSVVCFPELAMNGNFLVGVEGSRGILSETTRLLANDSTICNSRR